MKHDREIVLAAVQENGFALEYVGERMRNDKEIVLEAVKRTSQPLECASQDLLNDKEFLLEVVRCGNNGILNYLPNDIAFDKEFVLQAIKLNSFCIGSYGFAHFIPPSLAHIVSDKERDMLEVVKNKLLSAMVMFWNIVMNYIERECTIVIMMLI
ncbi:hypothetical protein FDP41_009386 [Naegleria fowleri]|uniref:DUF4116 domain-containing protein n=1 Tax=Naegleria fowleri TaxID=5763 RepID=A0A6A5AY03_NAEFO|nr:uncharacterized protein FDP41_009386 [Naegleria fowleri]KAF0972483.1 hypothetical protein FDP41_009386 [Naegleria fowleri]